MRTFPANLAAAVLVLILAGCTQATGGLPSIHSSASAEAKANAAFDAANAALPLVYDNNDSTGTFSPAAAPEIIASGTSVLAASVYTFNETVSMTGYDPNGTGIFAEEDDTGLIMKGTRTAAGVGTYKYSGGVFLSGAVASGHVLFHLSLKETATTLNYSGSVTVDGNEYNYTGSQ